MCIRTMLGCLTVAALLGGAVPVRVQAVSVGFDSDRWVFANADTARVEGQLELSGYAYLDGVEFENGVIEVDVAMDGNRSYPGIVFRMQSPTDFERVYLRPHRAGRYPDAIQYTPTFSGVECWQLYNGTGYTAGADLPADKWVHFRIDVMGNQARVFLDDAPEPALAIYDLKHGISRGTIGVQGPKNATARFRNFSYRLDDALQLGPAPEVEPPPGLLTQWDLSQAYAASDIDFDQPLSAQKHSDVQWQAVESEPSGLINIARFVPPIRGEPSCVWARMTIPSNKTAIKKLNFGYSDYVNIFLNGTLLFSGNSAYRERDPSFLGIVGLFDAVPLHLDESDNELVLLIAESFGGWGFICQDGDAFFQHERLTSVWESPRQFKYPESVVYDKKRDVLYVSNYAVGVPGFISKVSVDGQIVYLDWVTGLNRPSGICLHDDRILVVERNGVAEIDPESGEIEERYPVPMARFPNDIAVSPSGEIFLTESAGNALIRGTREGGFEVWLQDPAITQPNGICLASDRVLVGCSGDGTIKAVDLADKTVTTIVDLPNESVMDGLAVTDGGEYIVGDNNGRIFAVTNGGERTPLLNTSVIGVNCADFAYIAEKKLIVIPTWVDHRVVAYRYDPSP